MTVTSSPVLDYLFPDSPFLYHFEFFLFFYVMFFILLQTTFFKFSIYKPMLL